MKAMKKFTAIVIVLSMLLCLLPAVSVMAEDPTSGYCGGEGDGTNLQWSLSADGELTITGKGAMADYSWDQRAPWSRTEISTERLITKLSLPEGLTTIGDYAFYRVDFSGIRLDIPETVTRIGDYAFEYCGWTDGDLYIPDSVTEIGNEAFYAFPIFSNDTLGQLHLGKGLRSIGECAFAESRMTGELTLPDSLTELGTMAFWCCSGLDHVTFGKNLRKIGDGAFGGCAYLTGDLTLPEGLVEIGEDAFSECTRLFEPLTIPDSVEIIGDRAFEKCFGFPEIRLGSGVKTIGKLAFYDCYRVCEPVTIPASVTEIGDGAFDSMDLLPGFVCEGSNFCMRDGLLYTGDGKKLLCWPETKEQEFYIPEGTTAIGGYIYDEWDTVTGTLVIPEGVTEIGDGAFFGCEGATGLQLPSTLRNVGEFAFDSCGFTGELILPDGLETIGSCAFGSNRFTGNLWIPDSVSSIGDGAFWDNPELGSFAVIGKGVENIDNWMFDECWNLHDVYFLGDAPAIPNHYEFEYEEYRPQPFEAGCRLHYLAGTKGWANSEYYNEEDGTLWGNPLSVYDGTFAEPFRDVAPSQYYTAPIAWAVEKGITTGKTAAKFAPEDSCTRGQMVTFLWRAAGCPEPETKVSPFEDVSTDAYYAKAILWASENGIVNGMGDGKFAPDKTVTRGQMATILYRYSDGRAEGENPFTDVAPDAYYYDAVRWAYAAGITTGKTASTFDPDNPCTRSQIVTFLYRTVEA